MSAKAFLVVCLNPTVQRTFSLDRLERGQVNRVRRFRVDASGKGVNVARILHQLGERVVHLTQSGGELEKLFMDRCSADGLDVRPVHGDVEIRQCYTILDGSDRSTTEVVEAGHPTPAEVEGAVWKSYRELLPEAHTVIVSGSKAPGFSDELYPSMVREARERDVRVVLDIRNADLVHSLPHGPSLVKINVNEFAETFLDDPVPEETDPDELPPVIRSRMVEIAREGRADLVLTNGAHPVMYVDGERVEHVAPTRVEPVNTIGSGDAVTAGIAAGLARGMSLREAIGLGLDCARRNVRFEKPGTIE
ncbi:MAG: 1-phosphofructokinase family hexose kinase [Spirochaetota bacterium]